MFLWPSAGTVKGGTDMDDRTTAAFWERFTRTPHGCLVWTGYYNPRTRYGSFTHIEGGKSVTSLAHRLAWELLVGPIPKGMIIDHGNPERGCLNRGCGEPSHLEPITQAENVRRRVGHDDGGAFHRNKTHCPQGHPYEGENLYTKADGSRHCRACARATSAAYAAKKREENPLPPRQRKQVCVNGHALTDDNVINFANGKRSCRMCKRADVQRYRAKAV